MSSCIEFYFKRATRYFENGKYDEAIKKFTLIIDSSEASHDIKAKAYLSRGIVKGELDMHEEAIVDYDKAIKLKPNNAEAYLNELQK